MARERGEQLVKVEMEHRLKEVMRLSQEEAFKRAKEIEKLAPPKKEIA